MRKQKISAPSRSEAAHEDWLPLDELAEVEFTSEDEGHPVEGALTPTAGPEWRAEAAGAQTIRLNFFQPVALHRIRLVIEERERARTQELVLCSTAKRGGPWREIVRQQFNFSPAGASREEEDYQVNLPSVAALELRIVPDISGGDAVASLRELRLA